MDKPNLPKMLKKIYLYLLLLSSFVSFESYAQSYPISVSTQIKQPSPIYLSHYADASTINSPIKIQIVLNDLTISNRQVKLKIYFQGNGISFNTNDFVAGARPLYLEGGVPLQLTNVDLAPYFEYQNLLGLTPNQYAQPLPEGLYNIYVEVYDFATGRKLSNKTGTNTIIFQNDPPFLNLPLNNASFMQQNIQNIVFGWTPRSINVSNVEYEFSLVEIWDKYTPIQNAFAYSPPLYTTTTRNTTLQYGINEPQLIPGKKYAWRVKAKAIFGAEEIGVFKNNGYSEIFSFDYEAYCTAPLAIATSGVSENQAKITWSGNIDNYDYQVNYREKNADSEWYKLVTPRENITLSNLKPNAVYEYTVGASCEVGKYTHSTIKEFTTLVKDEIAFQGCGIKPDPADLANKNPLPELFANDVVTAGDFPIVVLHSTGSNGTFTGDGYVTLPFLEKFRKLIDAADALGGEKINIGQFSRIKITFNNIGVNTDFKLISGEIVASYDKDNWDKMLDVDKITNDIAGSNGKPIEGKLAYEVKEDGVTLNPDGSTTIKGTNGESTTLPKSVYDQVYIDKSGDVVNIPANGSGQPTFIKSAEGGRAVAANTNGISSGGEVTQISSPDVSITFEDGPKAIYAFDELPDKGPKKLKDTYETLPTKDGSVYNVNYKAVSDLNGPDTLIAEADFENGKTKDDIVFKTNTGAAVDVKWTSATKAEIKLKRTLNFSKESIIATVKGAKEKDPKDETKTIDGKSDIAGKVNIWQLTQKPVINITLLSVNGASSPGAGEAKNFFNEVYNKVGIKFDVTTQKVAIGALPNEIQCGESGVFDVYTNDQNNIISQIESSADFKYNDKTYYVIYTGKAGQNNYKGFMPLGSQYAFVFNNGNLKTAAHELGHGIFGLKHPFSTDAESEKTDLLMDYGNGTVLSHNDWDIIHSGGWKFYGFQKSSSGALAGGYGLSPDFKFVSAGTSNIVSTQKGLVAEGHLSGFLDSNKVKYVWNKDKNTYTVNGESDGEPYKETLLSKLDDDKLVWLIYNYSNNCNEIKYIRTQYKEIAKFISLSDKTKAQEGLDAYIKKIDQINKEQNPNVYSALLGCGESGNGNGNTKGVYVKNLIKGEVKKEVLDKLEALMSGNSKNWITGEAHHIKGRILLTSESEKPVRVVYKDDSFYVDNVKEEIKDDEIVFWMEYNTDGKIKVKQIISGSSFDESISVALKSWESSLDWKQKSLFEKIIAIGYESVDGYFTAYYDMFDMLSSTIAKAKIKPSVYDCKDPKYNKIYAEVFSYLNFTSIIQDIIVEKVKGSYPEFNSILGDPNVRLSQIQFALFCGVYNGLIDVVKSVPDLAKLLISPLSSKGREEVSTFIQQLSDKEIFNEDEKTLACESCGIGISFPKIWYFLKEGISSQLDSNKPCSTAEFVGSIAGPIVVMCLGDEVAGSGIISRVASTTIKVFQYCDKIADPFRYAGMSFKFVKKASGQVFLVIRNTAGDVVRQIENDLFRIKVIIKNIEVYREFNTSEFGELALAGANGTDLNIDGIMQRVQMVGTSSGERTFASISKEIFGEVNETLLKRFNNLGLTDVELKKVIDKLGNSVTNGKKLADLLENVSFKNDLNKVRDFLANIKESTDLQDLVREGKNFGKEWQLLTDANRKLLKKSKAAIEALQNVIKNSKLKELGFTEDILAKIKASRLDEGDYATILNDLDSFGKKLASEPTIEFENFKNIIGKLTDGNPQNSQAAHWIIQDITDKAKDFVGKKWKIEDMVKNSDGNSAYIDVASADIPPTRIEYKWLTSATIARDDFIREFIKRDLFNAVDLSKLQWRIKGQKLTKTKLIEYLSSIEGKDAIKVLGSDKVKQLFPSLAAQINKNNFVDILIENFKKDELYNAIFK